MVKSDLFIENTGISMAQRLLFPEAERVTVCGIDMMHAESGNIEYHTLITGEIWLAEHEQKLAVRDAISAAVSHYLKKHAFPKNGVILFAGLGNASMSADSLGHSVSKRIAVTAGLSENLPKVYSFPIGIPAKTGFDSATLVRSLAKLSKADIIVCVDALTAISKERLQAVIQISDAGISPGSAFSHTAEWIDKNSMGVPVISIGVPMAIREDALTGSPTDHPLLVMRAETDVISDSYAALIASGINRAFFGNTR